MWLTVILAWCASLKSMALVRTKMTYLKVLSFLILILLFCGILYYHSNPETEYLSEEPKLHSDRLSQAGTQGYYVRHCTTDRVLGKTPKGLQTAPFEVQKGISPENSDNRKSSFQHIFKNKLWIEKGERNKKNVASGKQILNIQTELSEVTYLHERACLVLICMPGIDKSLVSASLFTCTHEA